MRAPILAILAITLCLLAAPASAQDTVTVLVGDHSALHSEDVEIPIEVTGAVSIGAMRIEMTFDPSVLTVAAVRAGDLVGGGILMDNKDTPGLVTISVIHATGFSGDGVVVTLIVHVEGEGGDSSSLHLQNVTAHHFETKALKPKP